MWSAFKRNMKSDIKVAQFAGYVSEHAAYHHGETSLQGAIISLAQNFVGSNNLNLLTPCGQFGTRLQGGKDAASSRYIYTKLEKIARLIFHPADDKILDYLNEEGQGIEPRWYMPVLPLVLVNGAEGIGTGWSTSLPNFSVRDIVVNLKHYICCEPVQDMCPWYLGFKGSIVPSPDKEGYEIVGVIEKRGPTTIEVSELPVRKWTQDYKEMLQGMISTEGPGSGQIEDLREYHTEGTVHFVITVTEAQMASLERIGLEKSFKLRTPLSMSNMFLFDRDGKIRKYNTVVEILEDFAELRLEYYNKRKAYLIRILRQQLEVISEKVRFILAVISEKLKVKNRKKDTLIEDLRKQKFRTLQEITEGNDEDVQMDDPDEGSGRADNRKGGWEYLLGMPLWSLTNERVLEYRRQLDLKKAELEKLETTAPEEMWLTDLDAIVDELDDLEAAALRSAQEEKRLGNTAQKRGAKQMLLSGGAKKPRVGDIPSAPPPVAAPSSGGQWLDELQARQLSRTASEFPELFTDVLPANFVAAATGNSLGKFAKKAKVATDKE